MTQTLRSEIAACLASFTPEGATAAQTAWVFPREFSGFQGHFPNQPVCPGVCVVLAQLVAAQRLAGRELELVEIENVKFMWPVFPERQVDGRLQIAPAGNGCWRVQAELKRGARKIAKMALVAMEVL